MYDKLIQQLKSYELSEEIYQENKIRHLVVLKTLYKQYPEIYFRQWYFFKTFKEVSIAEWKQWNSICELYEEVV